MVSDLKLGKLPARKDIRTLKLSTILRTLPPIPDEYDIDAALTGITDNRTFANDKYGDCVIAARAHMTLRFEKFEQGKQPEITDKNVTDEYFKETGGPDTGLNMLNSLNYWRQYGWTLDDGKIYKIHAFAAVDWLDENQVKAAIYLFRGIYFGIRVAKYYYDQFNKGNYFWDVVADDGDNIGGHALYGMKYFKISVWPTSFFHVAGYNNTGPVFITWGKYAQVTWAWWNKYVDEAYIVIDEQDTWIPPENNPLDTNKLEQYLADINNTPSQQISITTLILPDGIIGIQYAASIQVIGGTTPYTWILKSGILPPGIWLSYDGSLSGTPTMSGMYGNLLFMVVDSIGNESGIYLSINIKENEPEPTPSSCRAGKAVAHVTNAIIYPVSLKYAFAEILNFVFAQECRHRRGRFMCYRNELTYMNP